MGTDKLNHGYSGNAMMEIRLDGLTVCCDLKDMLEVGDV